MEKRLLTAVALSLLIFVLYDKFVVERFFPQPPATVQTEEKPSEKQLNDNPSSLVKEQKKTAISGSVSTREEKTPVISSAPEQRVHIESPLYRAEITSSGVRLSHMYLKKYRFSHGDTTSGVIDIISQDVEDYPLALRFSDPSFNYLHDVNFVPSVTKVDFKDKEKERIDFVYEDAKVKVIKSLTFHRDSYLIDYALSVLPKEAMDKSLAIQVGPGLVGEQQAYDLFDYKRAVLFVDEKRTNVMADDYKEPQHFTGSISWVSVSNKYFLSLLYPSEKQAPVEAVTGMDELKNEITVSLIYNLGKDDKPSQLELTAFFGPQDTKEMEKLSDSLSYVKDYGIFSFFANPLFALLTYLNDHVGNWGWSIVLLTIIIKIIFYPLTKKGFSSMKKMKDLQPQLKALQEKYKDDRNKLSSELMALYRDNKVNPMGGCLPMLLQVPIFIALYNVLLVSIEMRGSEFIWWIHDLSEKDPYYITPIFLGITMFVQQKVSPPVGDPLQQKVMMFLPVIFTFLFMNFPAGLVVYWIVNNILTISQQWVIFHGFPGSSKAEKTTYTFKEDIEKENPKTPSEPSGDDPGRADGESEVASEAEKPKPKPKPKRSKNKAKKKKRS